MNITTKRWILGLGLGGLLPFVGCALATTVPAYQGVAQTVMLAYAAVILSFLGAVHWGLVMSSDNPHRPGLRLVFGVVPSLIGWAALLVGQFGDMSLGLGLAAIGFVATIIVERDWNRAGLLPPGYLNLRMLLSVLVCASLLIASLRGISL